MKEIGIYVHIPFCKQKCKYCDFVSFDGKEHLQEEYFKVLLNEIENCDKTGFKVSTIYFGGGTPSVVSSKLIVQILNKIKNKFEIENDAEITIEVNPGTVDKEKLIDYKNAGFNRISIGLQSTKNEILRAIGRIHTYEDFQNCYKLVKEVGFNNINVDLMLALPLQSLADLEDSIRRVVFLQPNHISVYSLILEEGTELEKEIKNGMYAVQTDKQEREMYILTKKLLEFEGYKHYEISNFAKPGFESKHNLNCWNQEEYLGFGLAAHSYFDRTRFSNTINLEKYCISQRGSVQINEIQTDESQRKEYMMLGLRKLEGVNISAFERKFGINPLFYFRFEIAKLVDEDLLEVDLDNIKLTRKGLDFANIVFQEFI